MIIYFWNLIQVFSLLISLISRLLHHSPKCITNKFMAHLIFGIDGFQTMAHCFSNPNILYLSPIKNFKWVTKQRENLNNTTIHFTSRQMWPVVKTYPVWKYIYLFFFSFWNFLKNKTIPTLLKVVTQSTFSVSRSVCWKFVKCSVIKTIQIAFSNLPYNHVYILTVIDFEI